MYDTGKISTCESCGKWLGPEDWETKTYGPHDNPEDDRPCEGECSECGQAIDETGNGIESRQVVVGG